MISRTAVYPGTFDPVTLGHLDIITRAARLFDRLVIGVAASEAKGPLLTLDDRLDLVRQETAGITGCSIDVQPMRGLLVAFAAGCDATAIVRGLRNGTDLDYEHQMVGMNHRMAPDIETVFLLAGEGTQFVTATLVRQIAQMGGDYASFVSPVTFARMQARLV